jgi:dienelactone hydrolase
MASFVVLILAAALRAQAAQTPALPPLAYDTLFYMHDGLKLEAYLYTPQGPGPFALIVYNHGSAVPGEEAREWPAPYIARLFVPAGYAVLVPERRGYGRSEGSTFTAEIGRERGPRFVRRQEQEAGDINAALEYVLQQPGSSIDRRRIAIVGYSFGGIVTTIAAGRSDRYAAVVVQAPGSLNWTGSEALRKAMVDAAGHIRVPAWCGAAENDATTESAREVCARVAATGAKTSLKIYPPFTGGGERPGNPPGHALFGPRGVDVWKQDVLAFLASALR